MALNSPTLPRPTVPAQLRLRLTAPLYRNGYALIAGSAITSALGLAFWVLAARLYSREAVGIGAALIAAMTLLANVAQLNLKSALNRFLPRAGRGSRRLVLRAYAFAASLAAVAATAFVAGLDVWAPDLGFVGSDPVLAVWFVICTAAWTVFVLQDSILAGIRQAAWVPAENGTYALAKIGVLVTVAAAAPAVGVFVAWSVPVLVLVVAVNVLLFRRLLPRHASTGPPSELLTRDVIRAYWAADAAAYLVWAGTIGVLPLIVLGIAGAEATADFSIAWSIAYSLYLVSSALGMSLLTEGARDPGRLAEDAGRTLREALRIVVPAVAVLVLAAPLLMGLLGEGYADGVGLVRLLALSAVPYAVTSVWVTRARVQRRMRVVVAAYGALCATVLAAGVPLLALMGVQGLGIAWLAAQTAVAAGLWLATHQEAVARWQRTLSRLRLDALARWRWLSCRRSTGILLDRLGEDWRLHQAFATDGEVAVAAAGPRGRAAAVIKRARGPAGELAVARQRRALLELHADRRLRSLLAVVPSVLADGTLSGRRFVAESAVGGIPATALGPEAADGLVERATAAIGRFHRATRRTQRAGDRLAEAWIDTPIAKVARLAGPRHAETLRGLRADLRERIEGRRLTVCLTHGDLCAENLRVDPASGAVVGIIDWEHASWLGSPDSDVMHLRLTARARSEGRELGAVVVEALAHGGGPARGFRLSEHTAVLLAWLQHAAAHADRSAGAGRVWRRRNVDPVLEWLAGARPVPATARAVAAGRRAAGPALVAALTAAGLAAAAAADPRAMSDGGLLTVLPPAFFAALALLTASFAVHAFAARRRPVLLGAHVVALVALLHATPVVAYGTLRYSWAWKHVGVVDFISRHDAVDPGTQYLSIYHYWPGFFGADAMATKLAGLPDAIGHAMWAPPVFQLLNVGALVFVLGALDARQPREVARLLADARDRLGRPGLLLAPGVRVLPLSRAARGGRALARPPSPLGAGAGAAAHGRHRRIASADGRDGGRRPVRGDRARLQRLPLAAPARRRGRAGVGLHVRVGLRHVEHRLHDRHDRPAVGHDEVQPRERRGAQPHAGAGGGGRPWGRRRRRAARRRRRRATALAA